MIYSMKNRYGSKVIEILHLFWRASPHWPQYAVQSYNLWWSSTASVFFTFLEDSFKWTKLFIFYLYNTELPRWHTKIHWEWYTLTHLCRNELLEVVHRGGIVKGSHGMCLD